MTPYKLPRKCEWPGCSNDRPCPEHEPKRSRGADRRETSDKRGYDNRYRRIRAKVIAQHPYCHLCGQTTNLVTHHMTEDPHDHGPDGDALMVLCRTCHERIHGRLK